MSKLSEVKNRPATLTLTSRVDARYLATLALYWNSVGETPSSISELIRLSMESFAELLTLSGKADFPQTQEEAIAVLDRMSLKVQKINPRNMATAMIAEGMSLDSLTTSLQPSAALTTPKTKVSKPVHQVALANLEGRMMANLENRMSEELQERMAESNERTEEFKKSLGIIPEQAKE